MEDKGGTMDRDVSDESGVLEDKGGQMDRITDVLVDNRWSRWIKGGLNGQKCVISVYCGGGLWFSLFVYPSPYPPPLYPLFGSTGQ